MLPFLKWLGRKDHLAHHIIPLIPSSTKTFYEPFLGSGAITGLLSATHNFKYVLNEGNKDLYWVYKHLVTDQNELLRFMAEYWEAGASSYWLYRNWFNTQLQVGDIRRSAMFLYFNRFGYNGLCRYNLGGAFNTPKGTHKTIKFPQPELEAWGKWLRTYPDVSLDYGDFATSVLMVGKGDTIYFDPPYYPLSKTSNFVSYGGGEWNHDRDHMRLAEVALSAAQSGATVIASNSDVPAIRELYINHFAEVITLPPIRRNVSGTERGNANEILAVWRQK